MRDAQSMGHAGPFCPEVIAGVSHGSHVCAFYETNDDLEDLVAGFFAAGVERDELCVWITPDLVSGDEARSRLSGAVLASGIEFHRARDVYLARGRFARDRIVRFWDQAIQRAGSMNRSGTRVSGDAFWLQRNDWSVFLEYENDINSLIANRPIAILCTYPVSVSKGGDPFDVVRAHQFAIAKRRHEWEVIAAPTVAPDRQAEIVGSAARIASLTGRERQVLDAIIDGHANKAIAHDLGLDVRTIETHRGRLMRRLGVRTMVEAVRLGTLARIATPAPLASTV